MIICTTLEREYPAKYGVPQTFYSCWDAFAIFCTGPLFRLFLDALLVSCISSSLTIWTVFKCLVKLDLKPKVFPQWEHFHEGLSEVWRAIWTVRFPFWLNILSHISQIYFFKPRCQIEKKTHYKILYDYIF